MSLMSFTVYGDPADVLPNVSVNPRTKEIVVMIPVGWKVAVGDFVPYEVSNKRATSKLIAAEHEAMAHRFVVSSQLENDETTPK